MPSCVIVVLLYIFVVCFYFSVAGNCSIVALRNNSLYKYKDIILPSLCVSTLYDITTLTRFDDIFKFAVIADHLL